jgi:FtsP/CotA-like multicopper oxidase with cupredoxin domain
MKKILTSVMAVMMLIWVGSARAGDCPADFIEDPPEFDWTGNEGILEIAEASFTIKGAPAGENQLTTRAYGQNQNFSIPGPTIRIDPGQTYILSFMNSLDWEVPSPVHNDLKDPNITNLHTHGFHVSGETPADDVVRLINGQQCADYMYEVQADHMGGTLWYHAHHHGSTNLQVAGGAFGMLIVDDSNDGIPADVRDMTERLLAIGFLDPGVAGDGGDNLIQGTLQPTWTVNGEVNGSLCMPPNEWQHFRVLLADRDARVKTLSIGDQCEVVLMVNDGVWRTEVPKALTDNSIDITGASRADLAVRCTSDSTISVGNTVVADIVVDATLPPNHVPPNTNPEAGPYNDPDGSDFASGTWSVTNRPHYLRDLRDTVYSGPLNTESINMGARTVNGSQFDVDVPTFPLLQTDAVQEWSIKGARNHPFHLHVYHQQVQADCGPHDGGEYYDTIAGNCLVRFDTNANDPQSTVYDGRTIMHCHILSHEDEGAMGWAQVDGGLGRPTLPGGKQALYHCGNPTPVEDICNDGIDDDNDGLIDGADPDCGGGCTPTEPTEVTCNDGVDNDCDTFIDCADSDCSTEPTEVTCDDGIDNDCDGLTDGNDPDCGGGGCVPTHSKEKGPRCSDGIDNDCDTLIDGADPDC